ncbi:MAG: TIGR02996 domain-containing protein [Zavarzinella sp.]
MEQMNLHERFLEAICAEPDDDLPRLVYADWLDAQNNPRGEFIRLQCLLHRLPTDHPTRKVLAARTYMLSLQLKRMYREALLKFTTVLPEYQRGFIESIVIDAQVFIRNFAEIFRLAPIQHVTFIDVGNCLSQLFDCPGVARLRSIAIFAQHLGEDLGLVVANSPHLERLQTLKLRRNRLRSQGAALLANTTNLPGLTTLDCSENEIGDEFLYSLARSRHLNSLKNLIVSQNEITLAGLQAVLSPVGLPNLSRVVLQYNQLAILERGRTSLQFGSNTGRVQHLDLSHNGLNATVLSHILEMNGLDQITDLNLSYNDLGNQGAWVIAHWPGACHLENLNLGNNRISDDGARVLARANNMYSLKRLDLRENPIHNNGAKEFLDPTVLPSLEGVELSMMGISGQMWTELREYFDKKMLENQMKSNSN